MVQGGINVALFVVDGLVIAHVGYQSPALIRPAGYANDLLGAQSFGDLTHLATDTTGGTGDQDMVVGLDGADFAQANQCGETTGTQAAEAVGVGQVMVGKQKGRWVLPDVDQRIFLPSKPRLDD